jgi:hypothetical protein
MLQHFLALLKSEGASTSLAWCALQLRLLASDCKTHQRGRRSCFASRTQNFVSASLSATAGLRVARAAQQDHLKDALAGDGKKNCDRLTREAR